MDGKLQASQSSFPTILARSAPKTSTTNSIAHSKPPRSSLTMSLVYVSLGLLNRAVCLSHSFGLYHLPVSTYSLICAPQLLFSVFFSFFLNSQKFTLYIVISLVLLTISSILLLFQAEFAESSEKVLGRKCVVGLICTICASAGYDLVLSMTQFSMEKIVKRESFSAIMSMTVYQSMVATFCALAGLFRSGDWIVLRKEMEGFGLGKCSYVISPLTWAAISWQLFNIGAVGLVIEVSSLYSNDISVLSLPVGPVLAIISFHDKIEKLKVIAMVLAIWGIMSYCFQHYINSRTSKSHHKSVNDSQEIAPREEATVQVD